MHAANHLRSTSTRLHSPPPNGEHDSLKANLEDMVELLHLWKNEAYTYRLLAEAVVTGHYTRDQAERALATANFGPESLRLAFLPLTQGEHAAYAAIATFAQLQPHEFLWSCLDAIMTNGDDQDLLAGAREAAQRRFALNLLPDWAR